MFTIVSIFTASFAWSHPLCNDIQQWLDQRQDEPYWLMAVNLPNQSQSSLIEFSFKEKSQNMIDYFIDTKEQHKTTIVAYGNHGKDTQQLDIFFDYYPQFKQHLLTGVERPGVYNLDSRKEKVALSSLVYTQTDAENGDRLIVPFVSLTNGFTILEYSFDAQKWFKQEHKPNYYKSINEIQVRPNTVFRLQYESAVTLIDGDDFYQVKYNNDRWEGVPLAYLEALDENKDQIIRHLTKKPMPLDCQLN